MQCPKWIAASAVVTYGLMPLKSLIWDQYHIKYEACLTCSGTFTDAVEFADLKDHTVVERFR
ncbi:MAG: hypothetical protein ACJAX5_002949 [Patiriisocius sp.]|jgi:hypothetical protein